jgi:biotin carboxylase
VDRVVPVDAEYRYAAAYLAHLLGLSHNTCATALNTCDRRRMKSLARAAGLEVARGFSLTGTEGNAELTDLERTVGYPLVLKPASGPAPGPVLTARDRGELDIALATFRSADGARFTHLLAEERVEGERFHVDAVWRDGRPWTLHVGRYLDCTDDACGSVLLPEAGNEALYGRLRAVCDSSRRCVGGRNRPAPGL